jgi:hypothetical protein
MRDGQFRNGTRKRHAEGLEKTPHLPVTEHLFRERRPDGNRWTSPIPQPDTRNPARYDVEHTGRKLPLEKRILPPLPVSAYEIVAFSDFLDQTGNLAGGYLEIGIEGNDHVTARCLEPGGDGRVLSVIMIKPDKAHGTVTGGKLGEASHGIITAAVIDENDLVIVVAGTPVTFEHILHGAVTVLYNRFIVI